MNEVRFTPKPMETAPLDRDVMFFAYEKMWIRGRVFPEGPMPRVNNGYVGVIAPTCWAELNEMAPACSNTQNPNPEPTVEDWRNALEALADEQNGVPLPSYHRGWNDAMREAYRLLGRAPWEDMPI